SVCSSTNEFVGLRLYAELPTICCASDLRHTSSVRTMYVHVKSSCHRSDADPRPPENVAICSCDGGGGNRTRAIPFVSTDAVWPGAPRSAPSRPAASPEPSQGSHPHHPRAAARR